MQNHAGADAGQKFPLTLENFMLLKRKPKRAASEMEADLAKARDEWAKADADVARLEAELGDAAALSAAEHGEVFAAATAARAKAAAALEFIVTLKAALDKTRQAEAVAALAARRTAIEAKVAKFAKDYGTSYSAAARRLIALLTDAAALEREVDLFNSDAAAEDMLAAAEAAGVEIAPLRAPDGIARAMEIDGRMRAPDGRMRAPDRRLHDEIELPGWRETDPPYRAPGTWRRTGVMPF